MKLKNYLSNGLKTLAISTILLPTLSHALTLDAFQFANKTTINGVPNQKLTAIQNFGGAIGGTRSIEYTMTSTNGISTIDMYPGAPNQVVPIPSNFGFNNSFGAKGTVLLSYDGDNQVGVNQFNGLGSLDLKSGGATGLNFDTWFDFSFTQPLNLKFTFYDASDLTGNTYSSGTYVVDKRYDNNAFTTLFMPFANLTQFGNKGAANLSNIGAFSLQIGESYFAADFGITNLRTNSSTSAVPEPTTVGLMISGLIGLARRKKATV